MEKTLLMFSLAVLCTAVAGQTICTGSYTADGTSSGINWSAMWSVSENSQYANFTVMARTTGWIAIGFSLDQLMPNTDIVVGAANEFGNESYVSDRYATARAAPPVDAMQNIMNTYAEQVEMNENTYTIVRFTRPVSSDDDNDLALDQNLYILYAWGMENNFDASDAGSIMQHGSGTSNRGFSSEPISIMCAGAATPTPTPTPGGSPLPSATIPTIPSATVPTIPTLNPGACTGSYTADGTSSGINWSATWSVSEDSQYANFTMMARTTGWIAIGFSLNQAMPMTDIVVGAANDFGNESYVSDRYATARAAPAVDAMQNIMNTYAEQVEMGGNNYTIVRFTRPVSSDDPNNLALNQNLYILYAWGVENNFDASDPGSIMQHGGGTSNRGFSSELISILCAGGATPTPTPIPGGSPLPSAIVPTIPTPNPGGAAAPVATATVLILVLIALLAILF